MTSEPIANDTGIHHVAYACRDTAATVSFYEDLVGFPLIHTEVDGDGSHYLRHLFFDTGDGSSMAFFELHGMGERDDYSTAVSTGNGLPVWVNHIAFGATEESQREVRARMDAAGVAPVMEVDHGWCQSLYYLDPNQILIEFCRDTPGVRPDPEEARRLLTETVRPRPPAEITLHEGVHDAPNP